MPSFGSQRGQGGGQRGRGGFRGRGRGGGRGGRGAIAPKLPALLRDQMAETYGTTDKKDRRRHHNQGFRPLVGQQPRRDDIDDEDEDEDATPRAGPSRQAAPAQSKKSQPSTEPPPKKKKKKELRLPDANTNDAEDGEIEWLEYALRNEKGKGKEEESDGLDGQSLV